jgi:hypothetical protein
MLQKIRNILMTIGAVFAVALPLAVPVVASADSIQDNVCKGANDLKLTGATGTCATTAPSQDSNVDKILTRVINIFSIVVGVVAVIMIVVGGFRYITSGGGDKVKSAKDTIMYALIGLVIVALAQIIVKFVLNKSTSGL